MTHAPEAQETADEVVERVLSECPNIINRLAQSETADEVARAVERVTVLAGGLEAKASVYTCMDAAGYGFATDSADRKMAADLRTILSRLAVLEEERRLQTPKDPT